MNYCTLKTNRRNLSTRWNKLLFAG